MRRSSAPHAEHELRSLVATRRGMALAKVWTILLGLTISAMTGLVLRFVTAGTPSGLAALAPVEMLVAAGAVMPALAARTRGGRLWPPLAALTALFVVKPAILAGAPPALAAWVAAMAVTFAGFGISYRLGARTIAATVRMAAVVTVAAGAAAMAPASVSSFSVAGLVLAVGSVACGPVLARRRARARHRRATTKLRMPSLSRLVLS